MDSYYDAHKFSNTFIFYFFKNSNFPGCKFYLRWTHAVLEVTALSLAIARAATTLAA